MVCPESNAGASGLSAFLIELNQMQSYFKREVIIGFSIIFVSVAVFLVGGFFLSRDIALQADNVVGNRSLILERAAILDTLADLKNDAVSAADYRRAMNAILVTRDQVALGFSDWIGGLARGRDLSFSPVSFQGSPLAPADDVPGHFLFSIRVSGEAENILAFLRDIELQSPRFLVALDRFGVQQEGSNFVFSGNGKVFFREQ